MHVVVVNVISHFSFACGRIQTHDYTCVYRSSPKKHKNRMPDWFRPTSKNYELKHKSEIFILLKRDSSRLELLLPFFILTCDTLCRFASFSPFWSSLFVLFIWTFHFFLILSVAAAVEKLYVKRKIWFTARIFSFSTTHTNVNHFRRPAFASSFLSPFSFECFSFLLFLSLLLCFAKVWVKFVWCVYMVLGVFFWILVVAHPVEWKTKTERNFLE